MNRRRKMLIAVVGVIAAVLATATTTASSWASDTPLYRFRMEQHSSKMSYWPTAVNDFTYTVENGYNVDYKTAGYTGEILDVTTGRTCEGTCIGETCEETCFQTCGDTCDDTSCQATCSGLTCELTTCDHTCDTCNTCVSCTCWVGCPKSGPVTD